MAGVMMGRNPRTNAAGLLRDKNPSPVTHREVVK